jgi:hypothetical protein
VNPGIPNEAESVKFKLRNAMFGKIIDERILGVQLYNVKLSQDELQDAKKQKIKRCSSMLLHYAHSR